MSHHKSIRRGRIRRHCMHPTPSTPPRRQPSLVNESSSCCISSLLLSAHQPSLVHRSITVIGTRITWHQHHQWFITIASTIVSHHPSSPPPIVTTHHRHQLKRPLSVVVVQVTSGVVILARSKPVARRLTEQIQSDSVRKEYLARVVGTFPAGPILCEA